MLSARISHPQSVTLQQSLGMGESAFPRCLLKVISSLGTYFINRSRFGVKRVSPICSGGRSLTATPRSEEHTSELQSLMRISYAVFCLKKKNKAKKLTTTPI